MSKDWEESIDEHRRKARQIYFRVLVWGPSAQDNTGYKLRLAIRDHLALNGHSAKFSEELIKEGKVKPAPNPIHDETIHATVADLILVLYQSRGTQTEVDKILSDSDLARKAVVLIEETTWNRLMQSVSRFQWEKFRGIILKFADDHFDNFNICGKLDEVIENLQFNEYIDRLKSKLLL